MKKETEDIINRLRNKPTEQEKNSLTVKSDWKKQAHKLNLQVTEKAEDQKLILRNKLAVAVKHIIWFQLIFFNIIILIIVLAVTSNFSFFRNIDSQMSIQLFEFLKYYISATIVELLGMLIFILHYVFSDSRLSEILFKGKKKKNKSNLGIEQNDLGKNG